MTKRKAYKVAFSEPRSKGTWGTCYMQVFATSAAEAKAIARQKTANRRKEGRCCINFSAGEA